MGNFKDLLEERLSGDAFDLQYNLESRTIRLEPLNHGTHTYCGGSMTPNFRTRAELKGWLGMLRQELDQHEKSGELYFDEWEKKRNCPQEETEIPDSFNLDDLRW